MDDQVINNEDKKQDQAAGADDLVAKLAETEKRRDEYLAGWQRAKADHLNYKKDEVKRLEEFARYGNEDFLLELVGVLDNFDLAIAALEKQGPVEKGVYLIRTQLEDMLKKRGLERIPITLGGPFDPAVAEAIAEGDPPAGGKAPPGSVIEEIEPGYRLYDKILRPARVRVARGKG